MKSAPSIAFDYRPSRAIAVIIVALTILSIAGVSASGLVPIVKWVIAVMTLAYGGWILRRHLLPGFVRIVRGAGGWLLLDSEGAQSPVELVTHVRRGFLLVIEFRQPGAGLRHAILTPDNADPEIRRRLILVLAAGEPPSLSATI
jgi:toxin CptA